MTSTPEQSDDALMGRAAGEDPTAFGALFERYHRSVYGYLRRMTERRDEALDLTQETFLHAFRARESYRGKGAFRAWLYRIATNLFRSRLDSNRRTEEHVQEFARSADSASDGNDGPPGLALEATERRRRIEQALARLSVDERQVIVLRHFEEMKFREIADALGENLSTVKSRMRYGLAKLADILRPIEEELD